MSKCETKSEPQDISSWKCPRSHLVFAEQGSSSLRPALHCTHAMDRGDETDMSTYFWSAEISQSNGRLWSSPGQVGGWRVRGLASGATLMDSIRCFFICVFKKTCPGGCVCKGPLAFGGLYQCITAIQFTLSPRHRSPVLDSIYQPVGLSRIDAACFWYWERAGGGVKNREKACLRDILTAS